MHASLLATISQRLESFERERAEWQAERLQATRELDAVERWSNDQQALLEGVRQQVATVFSLLDQSPHLFGPPPLTREPTAGPPAATPAPNDADALPSEPAAMAS